MMIENTPRNPYHAEFENADQGAAAPFAGRDDILGRIYRHVTDPARRTAIPIIGQRRMGKSALLLRFPTVFRETHVGAVIALLKTPDDVTVDWVLALAEAAAVAAARRGFSIRRLDDLPPPDDAPGAPFAWFGAVFLPALFGEMRGMMRLALLFDDAHLLVSSVRQQRLPEDTISFLAGLMARFPELDILLTIDADREVDMGALAPLINPDEALRLTSLSPDAAAWLWRQPVRGLYAVTDSGVEAAQRASGGLPALVQAFGYHLFRKWLESPALNVFTHDDIFALAPTVLGNAAPDFQAAWNRLPANEKLTLAALSNLLYRDPLRHIDASVIESWIVETDTRMDITAINVALRGLEYRQWVEKTPQGARIKAGLQHTWLLDNATPDKLPRPSRRRAGQAAETSEIGLARRVRVPRWVVIAGVGVLLAALVAFVAIATNPTEAPPAVEVTVTLSGGATPPAP